MIYGYDLTLLVKQLKDAAETARALLHDHSEKMEPWMLHRTERAREDCVEAARTFEEHCKEVEK